MSDGTGEERGGAPRAVLLKLGGSLITDKGRPDTARPELLRRLAGEIAEGTGAWPDDQRLVVGHGSGSFGHETAARYRIHLGLGDPARLPGVPATQERAAALHRLVLDALSGAGLLPFSIAPSSALVAAGGRPDRFAAEPLVLALEAGLLPVVYGDVVMDREQGCAICSTESAFLALAPGLAEAGVRIERALWAGATPGILDDEGRTIDRIVPTEAGGARSVAGAAAETDVTGGMLHRLEAALALAERGVPSLVFDGATPGNLAAALRGEPVPGTRVLPASHAHPTRTLPRHRQEDPRRSRPSPAEAYRPPPGSFPAKVLIPCPSRNTLPYPPMADLEDLLLRTSRTFALSIPRLPEPTRSEVTIAYLLFRIADTFEDAASWPKERRSAALGDFDELVARYEREPESSEEADDRDARAHELAAAWTAGEPPVGHAGYLDLLAASPEVLQAFAALGPEARRAIAAHTRRTARGMMEFVARHDGEGRLQLVDLDELRRYCYVVAGIVGEMLTELFLLADPQLEERSEALSERAARFGEALQLVNILKDADADAEEGRRYLPIFGDRDTVFALAREDLRVAADYVATLQEAGASTGLLAFTALPIQLAWGSLDRVEAEGPGAKLSRDEVKAMVAALETRLEAGEPALDVSLPRTTTSP